MRRIAISAAIALLTLAAGIADADEIRNGSYLVDMDEFQFVSGEGGWNMTEEARACEARLRWLYDSPVPLDLRANLPGARASIALPADVRIVDAVGSIHLQGGGGSGWKMVRLGVFEHSSEAAQMFGEERGNFTALVEAPVEIDERTLIGEDRFGAGGIVAMAEAGGVFIVISGSATGDAFPELLASMRSLGPRSRRRRRSEPSWGSPPKTRRPKVISW